MTYQLMQIFVGQMVARMRKKLTLFFLSLTVLTACGKEDKPVAPATVNLEEKQAANEGKVQDTKLDLGEVEDFLFKKLDGQTLVRNYGEDTGWTSMTFGPDGTFTGSYLGKIANDGFDAGLTEYAWIWHRGEEIHTSDYKGKFKIVEEENDHVFKMQMEDFEITSEYGRYDDIYFNVDFALGIKPDADYYLYIPGTTKDYAPNEDSRMDEQFKGDGAVEKTVGFTIWNKYNDEVFKEDYK